jgi:hypothetical protein
MNRSRMLILGGLLAVTATEAFAQAPAAPAPRQQRVEDVRIIRDGPGRDADLQMRGDVFVAAPDIPWVAMAGLPEAVLEDAVKGAPFTADAVTEATQTLSDGNRIARSTTTSLARDGEGRTRREQPVRARFSSGEQPSATAGTIITLSDPVAGERYLLDPERRTARALPKMSIRQAGPGAPPPPPPPPAPSAPPPPPPPPPPPGDAPVRVVREMQVIAAPGGDVLQWSSDDVKVEELGTRDIEGVQATGTRRVVTIEAGAIGNEQPIQIVSERWYSPELKTIVLTRRSDPRTGDHTYRLTNIVRGEPDPSLFQVPADYTVEAAPQPGVRIERRSRQPGQP